MCNQEYDFLDDIKFDDNVFKIRKEEDIKK